jgi:hypothetical protein
MNKKPALYSEAESLGPSREREREREKEREKESLQKRIKHTSPRNIRYYKKKKREARAGKKGRTILASNTYIPAQLRIWSGFIWDYLPTSEIFLYPSILHHCTTTAPLHHCTPLQTYMLPMPSIPMLMRCYIVLRPQ